MEMADDTKAKVVAFVFGDVAVMLWTTLNDILSDLGHFGIKVVATIVIGLSGGIAGMVAKDVYPPLKERVGNLKQRFIKWLTPRK